MEFAEAFRVQAQGCRGMGSELYGRLCERCAQDIEAGGPVARILAGWSGHPLLDALPMRLLGAVHALALADRAPRLARLYPSTGGTPDASLADTFLEVVETHAEQIRPRLTEQVQTNEVRRSAALLGGFLRVARETQLPLGIFEIGSSAGFNLLWDRYAYQLGPHHWGDPDATVQIPCEWEGAAPDLAAPVRVDSRLGCDIHPIDVSDPEQRLRLESFVWPDQPERLQRLRAVASLVAQAHPSIQARPASEFLSEEFGVRDGRASVLFHSVMWWYLSDDEKRAVTERVEQVGEQATAQAPLAWLRMEGASLEHAEVRLRRWPDGQDQLLAEVHWHGQSVRWLL